MSTTQELRPIEALKQQMPTLARVLQITTGTGVDAEGMVRQEIEYLRLLSLTKPEIANCNPETVVLAMKGVLRKNLTLDPSSKLVYAMTRQIKIVRNGTEQWITALELRPSCRGELSYAYQCGSILDHENPQVEYDGDGKVAKVWIRLLKPSTPTPRWEKYEYSEFDFERWRRYSHKDRGRKKPDFTIDDPTYKYANELYTAWRGGIDPEFARAKCILRALDKLGTNSLALPKNRIVFDPKSIITDIDSTKEEMAAGDHPNDDIPYAEVISSTPSPTASQSQPAHSDSPIDASKL